MLRKCRRILGRVIAMSLALTLLTIDASAIIKEVDVWGARSINDEGGSDNRITMEELQKDFSDYVQTNGLREYFHRDQQDPTKVDMSEALSWLIDHEIINRDQNITVSNVIANKVPVVNIDKMDINDLGASYVNRSDAIMYIYKAVFGPVDARTIGVETDNIRVDDGVTKTLYQMMLDHDYFDLQNKDPSSIVQSESTGGEQQVSQSCVTTPMGHSDHQSVTSTGGNAGQQQLGWAGNISSSAVWRYTPQGDLYDSMFGDTNIFISNNNIAQQGNTGQGTQGLGVGSSTGTSSPDVKVDVDNEGTKFNGEGPQQNGNHNSQQTEWAGTGGLNQAIAIETDYKQIYYAPGADIMFYRTNDVVELYIQQALSKGLLTNDTALRTEYFNKTFIENAKSKMLPSWSPQASAYVVNRVVNKLQTASRVQNPSKIEEILGVNYTVTFKSNTLTIQRNNLFSSKDIPADKQFFTTERLSKMDAYRYIYTFIQGGEKKLSKLESDIVNYKYGMELDGVAATTEEVDILKYLIAKGILNFDDTYDFMDLYLPVSYDDFIPILYRTASKEARLDFSLVQLTDSETSWQARGYAPQSLYVVGDPTNGLVSFNVNPELNVEIQEPGSDGAPADGNPEARSVSFGADGKALYAATSGADILSMVETRAVDDTGEWRQVTLGAKKAGTVSADCNIGTLKMPGGYYTNLTGAAISLKDGTYSPAKVLEQYLDDCADLGMRNASMQKVSTYYEAQKHTHIGLNFCDNIWVIALLRNNPSQLQECFKVLDDKQAEWEKMQKDKAIFGLIATWQAPTWLISEVRSELEATCTANGEKAPKNLSFQMATATEGRVDNWPDSNTPKTSGVNTSSAVETVRYVGKNLTSITYTIIDGNGEEQTYVASFPAMNEALTGSTVEDIVANCHSQRQTGDISKDVPGSISDESTIAKLAETAVQATNELASMTGSSANTNAAVNGSKLLQFRDGKDGYLAWSQITQYNNNCANAEDVIPITRKSDLILYNKETNTFAYFATGDKKVAFVGTSIIEVTSDSLGVAFKDGEGASAEYYYHIDAIRLLMNAKQESAAFAGIRSLTLADSKVQKAVTSIPLTTTSGHTESNLMAIKALISEDDAKTSIGANGGSKDGPYFSLPAEGNTRWARFLSLSQSNRAANIIYSKKSYQNIDGVDTFAFAVLIFTPTDIEQMGTSRVTSDMSMQDLLDAAVKPPSTEAGLAAYNKNKKLCNAYANWMYGTTDAEYVKTGYLIPEVFLYYTDGKGLDGMPAGMWKNLTSEATDIKCYPLTLFNGAMCGPNTSVTENNIIPDAYRTTYWMSSDYRAIVCGERLYINDWCFPNLAYSKTDNAYLMTNSTVRTASFTLGSSFQLPGTVNATDDWVKNLRATVLETKSDGTVRCQFGPIVGMPLKNGTTNMVVDTDTYVIPGETEVKPATALDWTDKRLNRLLRAEGYITPLSKATLDGICDEPHFLITDKMQLVNTGKKVKIYANSTSTSKSQSEFSVVDISKSSGYTLKNAMDDTAALVRKNSSGVISGVNSTVTFLEFTFNAQFYTVKNGVLTYSNAEAADFLSPSLFTNLNDMLIDEMMNASNGAIPINEVPSGSLVLVGTGYYCSTGSDTATKTFVGYAHLDSSTGVFKPKVQDAARSYANHFIRGGNEYINISHFFDDFHLLPDANYQDEVNGMTVAQKEALNVLATTTLKSDGQPKIAVYPNGDVTTICNPGDSGAKMYVPVSIKFQDVLMAYPSSVFNVGGQEVQAYTICPSAANAVAGDFADLPFYTDSILEASLIDVTGNAISASYVPYSGDLNLMSMLRSEFQAAFNGDLYTLVRLVLFTILIWLFVASWLCYGFYAGKLMPIIDAIKHPTRDSSFKGIDLFKVVSFGTISCETEFKLGRFLQYDAIIAVLICIVWKSGSLIL